MNQLKHRIAFIFISLLFISCNNEKEELAIDIPGNSFQYIGLKDRTNVRDGEKFIYDNCHRGGYHPKIQVSDNYIYVTTVSGIYRKSLSSLTNTNWELFAFGGQPVLEFVKNGNNILAATYYRNSKALLLSHDGGKTFAEATPAVFLEHIYEEDYGIPIIFRLAQHPQEPNTLLISVLADKMYGILRSNDFGKNWETLTGQLLMGYQEWFLGYNPHDSNNIYNTGESMVFEAKIQTSYNNGQDWEVVNLMYNNCFHHIAFHPENPQEMICSGEFIHYKSRDKGRTWNLLNITEEEVYFYKTLYDKSNPNMVYTTGATRVPDSQTLFIFRSEDGGDNWNVFFKTELPGEGAVIDFDLYQDKLFLYTYTDGIYVLNTKLVK